MRYAVLLFVFPVWALDSIPETIEHAQAFALKKDRKEACATLNRALANTPSQIKARGKIVETLNSLSKVFFTDKGQRLYESGQVNLFENPDLAVSQLREAQNLEDENVLILGQLARAQILKQDCSSALVTLEMARSLNPHLGELAVLELRALMCAKRFDDFKEKMKLAFLPGGPGTNDKWDQAFGQYLLAQDYLRQNSSHKATEILSRLSEEFPQFPETYFFLAKAAQATDLDPNPWLKKYSILCKGLALRDRKKFSYEPALCGRLKEVDEQLAEVKHES